MKNFAVLLKVGRKKESVDSNNVKSKFHCILKKLEENVI
jgi:hypothetical protein